MTQTASDQTPPPAARPKARDRGAILMKAALEALDAAPDGLRAPEVFDAVAARVSLTPFDLETYAKSGKLRWQTLVRFFSIDFVRVGYIARHRGRWHITKEGRTALALPAPEIMARAELAFRRWWQGVKPRVPRRATRDEPAPDGLPDSGPGGGPKAPLIERAESHARAEIEAHVRAMGAYEFQDLVAALLRAMGYSIRFVAPPGPDGGTDILAYPDPLGAKTPHVRVQVKHRTDKARREEVAALRGIIRQDREIGLFVSSGGFTADAVREARHGAVHLELMDLEGVLSKWLSHYERMNEEDRSLLKLRPVYFLALERS